MLMQFFELLIKISLWIALWPGKLLFEIKEKSKSVTSTAKNSNKNNATELDNFTSDYWIQFMSYFGCLSYLGLK